MMTMREPELEVYEKKLRDVFDPAQPEFSAILARLSVLFEDLRIEEYGSRLDTLDDLDIVKGYRKIYFLRRSIATLVELAGAIEMLDQRPEFRRIKQRVDPEVQKRWEDAAQCFRDWKSYLSACRADFGGHFDHGSARHAVSEVHPGTVGQLVVVKHIEDEKGGVRLAYAMELVGAAMTRRKPDGQEDREWFHDMFVVVRTCSNEAVKAIHALSVMHLLEAFGRQMDSTTGQVSGPAKSDSSKAAGGPPRDAGYQRSLELHRELELLYPRIEQQTAYFRGMARVDTRLPQPPGIPGSARLDPLVCALSIKAATTKRAVLKLCEAGDGDNGLALTRVLLENACLLEWLIRGEGQRRLETYAMFTSVVHERIVDTVQRHRQRFVAAGFDGNLESDPYHRAVWRHVFCQKNGLPTKSDRPTWQFDPTTRKGEPVSVKQLFQEVGGADDSFEYDVLYGALGSDIVHSGPFSLSRTLRSLGARTFKLQPTPVVDLCTIALASSNSAMLLVLEALSQYTGIDLGPELDKFKARLKTDPYADGE